MSAISKNDIQIKIFNLLPMVQVSNEIRTILEPAPNGNYNHLFNYSYSLISKKPKDSFIDCRSLISGLEADLNTIELLKNQILDNFKKKKPISLDAQTCITYLTEQGQMIEPIITILKGKLEEINSCRVATITLHEDK